jgi:hypothetical protein
VILIAPLVDCPAKGGYGQDDIGFPGAHQKPGKIKRRASPDGKPGASAARGMRQGQAEGRLTVIDL